MLPLSLRLKEEKNIQAFYINILKKNVVFLNHHLSLTSVSSEGARTNMRNELLYMNQSSWTTLFSKCNFFRGVFFWGTHWVQKKMYVPLCEKSNKDAEKYI